MFVNKHFYCLFIQRTCGVVFYFGYMITDMSVFMKIQISLYFYILKNSYASNIVFYQKIQKLLKIPKESSGDAQ